MLSIEKQILYLISCVERLDVKSLIDIYSARGVSNQVIRNALARLKKDESIEAIERSQYKITKIGSDLIQSINRKPQLPSESWDKNWFIVMFEIPESERKKRDILRNNLLDLGFALLYKSVYISPWPYTDEISHIGDNYEISSCITSIKGTFMHNEMTIDKIRQLWRLDELNEIYKAKQQWFLKEFYPELQVIKREKPEDSLLYLAKFLQLGEVIAELGLRDPMLPEELLPEGWIGRKCFVEFQKCLQEISNLIPTESVYFSFVKKFI